MNNIIENIKTRRSIRSFKDKRISQEELNIILDAATYAPSALNQQSSLMVVIKNEILPRIIDERIKPNIPSLSSKRKRPHITE